MNSLILRTAARTVEPLLLLFSIFLLVAGHDEPGGGFVGGLIAAAAFSLHAIAYGTGEARRLLHVDPRTVAAAGLLLATGSALAATVAGLPLLTGLWTEVTLPFLGGVTVGTPLLFDAGVYLLVSGVTLLIVLTLAEE